MKSSFQIDVTHSAPVRAGGSHRPIPREEVSKVLTDAKQSENDGCASRR